MSVDVKGDQAGRGRDAPDERRRVPREPARRPPDLHPRRARRGRHDAPGLPQQRAGRSRACTTRCTTRRTKDVLTDRDRHGQRRLHAPVLQGAALGRGPRRRARRDRGVAAADLRLDGAQPRLQGGLPRHLRARTPTTTRRSQDNARRWYKESQERVYFMNHTLVNPPVDRDKDIHEVDDVFIHAVKETDEGVVVRGAKMVATGSALSNYNFVSYHGNVPIKKEEYALSFFAPMDHPDIKLLCRPSYEFMAAAVGSPFDYPLSSRFDENDSVLMFDDALIPWENFLIYGNLEIASTYHLTGFIWRALLQGCTRLAVKLDFLAGALHQGASRRRGRSTSAASRPAIGEILAWRNMFWALTDAMCHNPVPVGRGHACSPTSRPARPTGSSRTMRYPDDQGDHREPDRRRADRPARRSARRLEERGAAAAARPVLPRLERLRGARQDQARQAPVGRDRQRVRRPPRALRAHVLGQPRADAASSAAGWPRATAPSTA